MTSDPLNREQIVRVAIELLDADGVDGLSMRRLAGRIGSGATSIYWYVRSKDELTTLAADAAFGEIELPDPARVGWRPAASTMARGLRATILRHPWLPQVIAARPAFGPMTARHAEHAFTVFQTAGFADAHLDWATNALFAFVYGTALGEATTTHLREKLRQAGVDEEQYLNELIDRQRAAAAPFPRVRERYEAAARADRDSARDRSFEFGLSTVLDGLEARLTPAPEGLAAEPGSP
ncbi:TetR/AcrR family transcriptional regulator C-terminal domain-containing protein [Amycolatopsis sp. NPDC058986]|uniref:TetR/AcrR family transcriptional regulator C-terminal domain-containing protein n=1 Tax=unclassified Amycolatopsis TaxID=2618356 RepID=UPI00366EF053